MKDIDIVKLENSPSIVAFEDTFIPFKGSKKALCYDLKSRETIQIAPGEVKLIKLGIKTNFAWKLYSRSSLPIKKGLLIPNGVGIIDEDYRGEAMIMLYNFTKENVTIEKGERIAQMEIINEKDMEDITFYIGEDIFNDWENLFSSDRGAGGFGSTGK